MTEPAPSLSCRFYEQKYPDVDDVVVVEVKSIEQMGAYVALKEYNDVEGMILLSELSRRRIRSINKIIRVGRLEIVVVLRVDPEKGYIDLSKRRVSEEDIKRCEDKYNKAKAVHSMMRNVAENCHKDMESLYVQFGWPLYKKYGHAYDAFKMAIMNPSIIDEFNLEDNVKAELMKNIKRKLTPQPIKIRADIEVTCFKYEGIDAIKDALRAGQNFVPSTIEDLNSAKDKENQESPIKISLVAPPHYVVVTTSVRKQAGITAVNEVIEAIRASITKAGGNLKIQQETRAVQQKDDRELSTLMAKLEKENRDVAAEEEASETGTSASEDTSDGEEDEE